MAYNITKTLDASDCSLCPSHLNTVLHYLVKGRSRSVAVNSYWVAHASAQTIGKISGTRVLSQRCFETDVSSGHSCSVYRGQFIIFSKTVPHHIAPKTQ